MTDHYPKQVLDQLAEARAELAEARATNQRLNARCQQAESQFAQVAKAVAEWQLKDRGTYVSLRSLNTIAKAAGRDIPEGRFELHYQRVEHAEAELATVKAELSQALDGSFLHHKNAELHERIEQAETERDGAYRERAQLLAWLAGQHPAVLVPAPDVDEPGWQILYLTAAGQQLSWHIHPRDADLYGHVEQVTADDPRAQWDGHTTAEKYQRIAALAQQRPGCPDPVECGHEAALGQAEARIAAVRALADSGSFRINGYHVSDARLVDADRVAAALDGPADQPVEPNLSPDPQPVDGAWLDSIAAIKAHEEPQAAPDDDRLDPVRDAAWREMVQLGQELQEPAKPVPVSPWAILGAQSDKPPLAPTIAAMAELAERAHAEFLAEQLRLEREIVTAIEGAGLTIVRAEPVEQVAAHPAAIHRLRTEVFQRSAPSGLLPGQVGQLDGLPVVPDGSLSPGEVHLRPHPRSAEDVT